MGGQSRRFLLQLIAALGLCASALAQPPDVVEQDGYWQTTDGRPLFYATSSSYPPDSTLCGTECPGAAPVAGRTYAGAWVPLNAAPDASVGEPWSIRAIERPAQYYYNGRPVFTWSGEWDASAAQAMPTWRRLPVLGSPEILMHDDPSLLASPVMSPDSPDPEYPAASLRARETGAVVVRFCVDPKGGVHFVSLVQSSGYVRLDDATTRWVARRLVMRPARGNDGPVPVCGFVFTIDWRLPPDPRQAQPPQ